MDKPLRILHLDDDPDFPELVAATLQSAGLTTEVVVTADLPDFVTALDNGSFDMIFADYVLPSGNGIEALQAVRRMCPEVPFLLISGAIPEQVAIESLRAGATDYVLKTCLDRLEPVVRRAVHEARERAQRKFAETELIRRERYFRTLTENSLDILTIVSADGVFQYNSPSVKSVVGYEPKELDRESVFFRVHPDDLPGCMRAFERLLKNPNLRLTYEFRFRHRNGMWCHLESVGQNRLSDPEIAGVVINSRDVSDRRQAEAERRESEKQYRLIFDASPIPMWLSDTETLAFLEINEAAVQKYGFSHAEFLSMTSKDIRPSEEVPRMARHFADILSRQSRGGIGHAGVWRHRKKDGSVIDVEITWSLITFKGREALLTMADDVTERRKAADALEKSEASLATAQRIAHLGSWELDLLDGESSGCDLRWSDETYCIYGYEPRSIPVTHGLWQGHIHPDDRQRAVESAARALRDLEPYDIEYRIVVTDGEEKTVRERGECVLDGYGRPVQVRGIVMDLTERKRLEEQLRQSQKMEAIGQLAGGVAHDFNNILTVIQGHASLLLTDSNLSALAARSAQQINQAAERAAGLTRQLLTFSRRQVMRPRRLNLNEIVSRMSQMLDRILGEDIALQIRCLPNGVFIQGDASMIEQVLLNLAVNARDALPSGGQISIEVTVPDPRSNEGPGIPDAGKRRMVCLTFKDNGSGIAPEHLKRIFEPFYTTKEVGRGTGLGLATVYGIVKQHQGWIEVDSQVGKGATFVVFLPEAEHSPATPEIAGQGLSTPDSGSRDSARQSPLHANVRKPGNGIQFGLGSSSSLSLQERDEQNAGNGG